MNRITWIVIFAAIGVTIFLSGAESKKRNAPKKKDWESYKNFHGKEYESDDHEAVAKGHFNRHKKLIDRHNKLYADGKVNYKMELNKFADIPPEKFRRRNGHRLPPNWKKQLKTINRNYAKKTKKNVPLALADTLANNLPDSFDWRKYNGRNYVSPIKDQGDCGDCYAFSAVAAIESQILIGNQAKQNLSEQQITECSPYSEGNGCDGGWYYESWKYIEDIGGLTTEDQYPYTLQHANKSGQCQFSSGEAIQTVQAYNVLNDVNDTTIMQTLITQGPLSVTLNAEDLQWVGSGIYHTTNMSTDHAVLLIGYGTDPDPNGGDYWLIKNSWGTEWGDEGFFKVSRDSGQNAHINEVVAYVEI